MPIELHEGSYSLQQETSKKTVLQLKLTDSALRAIEVYQDELEGQRGKPAIQFNGNQGIIRIPTGNGNETQTFTFLLAANQSAAIDCLQQFPTRESTGKMAVLGDIQQKITINANDDSYSTTRKRMEIAKELEKNISTKVIKQPSGSKLGKKGKIFRRKGFDTQSSSFTHGRTSTPPPGRPTHSFARSASPLTSLQSVSPVPGSDLAGVRNKTKPVLSSLSSTTTSQPAPANARSLNEKVMHYIAVRPTRLAELTARLSRGGSYADKVKLQAILQQIAAVRTIRPGVFEYTLKPNLYNEVHVDWPGYNEDERSALRRKQAEITFRASDNRKRVIVSPESTPKNSPNQSSAQKALQEESYSNPVKKKARVSLYSKTSPNATQPRSVSPLESGALLDGATLSTSLLSSSSIVDLNDSDISNLGLSRNNSSRRHSPKRPSSVNSKMNKPSHSPTRLSSPHKPPPLSDSFIYPSSFNTVNNSVKSKEVSPTPSKNQTRDSEAFRRSEKLQSEFLHHRDADADGSGSIDDTPSLDSSQSPTGDDNDEFIRKYTSIYEAKKRDEYKSDFYAEYKEYRQLHEKVAAHSNRFAEWQKELDKQPKDTEAYTRIAKLVYAEYQKLKQNQEFGKERERMQYLHRKLKHIKDLVREFDCRQFDQQSSSNAGNSSGNRQDRPNLHRRPNDVAQKRPLVIA